MLFALFSCAALSQHLKKRLLSKWIEDVSVQCIKYLTLFKLKLGLRLQIFDFKMNRNSFFLQWVHAFISEISYNLKCFIFKFFGVFWLDYTTSNMFLAYETVTGILNNFVSESWTYTEHEIGWIRFYSSLFRNIIWPQKLNSFTRLLQLYVVWLKLRYSPAAYITLHLCWIKWYWSCEFCTVSIQYRTLVLIGSYVCTM